MTVPASASVAAARLGWVVDVQNDFMLPTGRLYVHDLFDPRDPGAVLATPAIERTVRWMRSHCAAVVFTGDWHSYGDREIDPVAPDARAGTYPPHCMGLSPDENERQGAQLLATITPGDDVLVLGRDSSAGEGQAVARQAVAEQRPVFLQKREFDAFVGNTVTPVFLRALDEALGGVAEVVVCGVATDVCVKHAVEGLLDRGYYLRVVTDATWGLGLLGTDETFQAWQARGASLMTSDTLAPNDKRPTGGRRAARKE